jgi:polysaccharide deacetylase 2 family uncharacterized protein YibQ
MGLGDLFRRNTVNDPFGGEDGFDGESRFAGQGPKIAMIASGVMFLLLVGGVAAVVLTGDEAATTQTVGGSFADLEIEDEGTGPTPDVESAASTAPPVVADSTAATDRSVERRPWLNAAPAEPRPGLDAKPAPAAKPAAPASAPAPAPPATVAAVTPPPAKPLEAKPLEAKPTEAKPAEVKPAAKPADVKAAEVKHDEAKPAPAKAEAKPAAKPAESKVAVMTPPPAAAAKAPVSTTEHSTEHTTVTPALQPVSLPTPGPTALLPQGDPAPEPMLDPARDIGGIPALRPADEAPGAPRRFDAVSGNGGADVAGGRPRLVEPPLPPTDKIAVAAPPPRYANLTDVKKTAGTAPPPASATKIAFIIEGLGLSAAATDAAINKLPAGVTLSFSPYARDLKGWMEKAKAKGHEVLIEVPMESKDFPAQDPGPLGLLTSVETKENQERLDNILKNTNGAVGIYDAMGSKFRESREHIDLVFTKLKASNLVYVQGEPGVRVGEANVPTALADVVVDERPFRAAIDARLDYAERLAKYQGTVVAAMGAKPVNFERLVLWLQQAEKKGVVLAPISQVLIK